MENNINVFTHSPVSDELLAGIKTTLPEFISEKRLKHTFFVEKEAVAIAESVFLVYNIPDSYKNDLRAAALLHDITKEYPLEKQLSLCNEFGISAGDTPSCAILHGKTAAHLSKKLFNINDTVFSAIFNHTTGKENMNVFDKIIFLADYIEESRTHAHCIETRNFFYDSLKKCGFQHSADILDKAIIKSLDATISYLLESQKPIDIQTVLARNFILKNKE